MSMRTFVRRDLPRLFTLSICVATQVVVARTAEPPVTDATAEVGRRDAVVGLLRDPAGNRDVLERVPPMDRPRPASTRPTLTARPGVMMADAQYVVVTPLSLFGAFETFAQYKRSQGTSALVVAVEQIQALYADAADLAEGIRQFLQDADRWWNTHFVLLGGDFDLVPARSVPNLSGSVVLGDEIRTDLYYAAIDGDWNADGDDVIGEFPLDGSGGDEIDFDPDLMVGRAPVRDAADVAVFVSKTIQYQTTAGRAYRGRGLVLAAENLFVNPNPNVHTMVRVAEDILEVGLFGLDPPPFVERRYGEPGTWPGWETMDEAIALERLGSGDFGWVLTVLPGDSGRLLVANLDVLDVADFTSLANAPRYFVMFVLGAMAADLEAESTLEALLLDPDGGCVAGLSHTELSFISPDEFRLGVTLERVLGAPGVTLGGAMNFARKAWLQQSTSDFLQLTSLSWILLGDPQITVYSEPAVDRPAVAQGAALFAGRPNPFNPSTDIRYRVPRTQEVELTVFDARGRRVAVLVQGIVEAGDHVARWDGRDVQDRPVGSGVYFYRLRTGDFQKTRKLVLVE